MLESAAADLEDEQAYDQADELRRRARRMRLDARRCAAPAPDASPER
jgi:hypothetical protein